MAREQSNNELLVISRIDLIDYYNKQIVPLDKKFTPMSESRNTGLCCFHVDTDPSLHYWKKKGIFHCFGCGYGGDVVKTHISVRRKYYGENLSIEKAIEQLATLWGIELDKEEGFIVKSVFDRAREAMIQKETYTIPKDVLSIASFRELNNKVKRSSLSMKSKVSNFENLDRMASALLINKK